MSLSEIANRMQQHDSTKTRLLWPPSAQVTRPSPDTGHWRSVWSAIDSLSEHMGKNFKTYRILFRTPKFN